MPRHSWPLVLLLTFIGLGGCKKDNSANSALNGSTASLVGSWDWVLSYNNGISSGNYMGDPTGDSLTPASTGIYQTLTFNADWSWKLVQNGSLIGIGVFKMDTLFSPGGPIAMLDLIRLGGGDSIVNHVIVNDTLVISNPMIVSVGVNKVYVREGAGK